MENNDEIFLSIVIPMYNSEKYIKSCLESLKKQSVKNFEVIIIDDDSNDNSCKISKEYLDKETRKGKVIKSSHKGQSFCRNIGISEAKGKYILFLDSDDYIENNLVEIIEGISKEDNYDMIIFDHKRIRKDNTPIVMRKQNFDFNKDIRDGIDVFHCYRNNNLRLWTGSIVYNRNYLLNNNLEYLVGCYGAEDLNFIFKCLYKAQKVKCIENQLSVYHQRENSLTNNGDMKKNMTVVDAMENLCEFIEKNSLSDFLECIIKNEFIPEHIMYQLYGCAKNTNRQELIRFLKDSKIKGYFKSCKSTTPRYSKKIYYKIKLAEYAPQIFIKYCLKK